MKKPIHIPPDSSGRAGRTSRNRRIAISCFIAAVCGFVGWTAFHPSSDRGDDQKAKALRTHSRDETRQGPGSGQKQELARMKQWEREGGRAILFDPPVEEGAAAAASLSERRIMGASWNTDPDPALAGFAEWANRYFSASESERAALVDEGVKAAAARRDALAAQIVTDPRRALANALPFATREQLPAAVQTLLEERVDSIGKMGVVHRCGMEGCDDEAPDFAEIGGRQFDAYRYGTLEKIPYVKEAAIHGIVIDNRMAVLDSSIREVEPGEVVTGEVIDMSAGTQSESSGETKIYSLADGRYGSAPSEEAAAQIERALTVGANNHLSLKEALESWNVSWPPQTIAQAFGDSQTPGGLALPGVPPVSLTTGGKRVLVMVAESPTMSVGPHITPPSVQAMMNTFNVRIQHSSWNKIWISHVDYAPWLTMPSNYTTSNFSANLWMGEAKNQCAALGYNLSNYDQLVLIHPNAPVGYVGLQFGNNIWLKDTVNVPVLAHEYGHTLWMPHASTWWSTDGDPMSPNRLTSEYGDWDCYMGNNFHDSATRNFNPYYLTMMNWLPHGAAHNATKSGDYTIYQHDGAIDINNGQLRVLKVPRDAEFNYWLSIRGETLASGFVNFQNGVACRVVSASERSRTHLLDLNDPGANNRDSPLMPGQEWYDSAADLRIRCLEVGGAYPNRYAKVRVTFGPTHSAAYRPLVSGGVYRFMSKTNLSVSLAGPANTNNNAPLIVKSNDDNDSAQKWVAWRRTGGSYSFNRLGTSQWLEVYQNSYANNADIVQNAASSSDAQKFYITQLADGYLTFGHHAPGGGSSSSMLDYASGTLVQYQWSNNSNQHWKAELVGIVPGTTVRILPRTAQGQALDAAPEGSNLKAVLWGWHGNQSQQHWQMNDAGGGWFSVLNHYHNQVLDVWVGPGKVGLWNNHNGTNQKWRFARVDGQWVRMHDLWDTSKAMDASGGTVNGSEVFYNPSNAGQSQQWRFADIND